MNKIRTIRITWVLHRIRTWESYVPKLGVLLLLIFQFHMSANASDLNEKASAHMAISSFKLSSVEPKTFVIKGKVVDAAQKPLPGVAVVLDSTKLGTATGATGEFMLSVPTSRGTLIFSSIGFKTKKVAFKDVPVQTLTVQLDEDVSKLDEVTIVAYGETSKREMAGSMSVVKADDIKNIPTTSIGNLLQGRIAGMDVTNVSGAPGGGGTQVTIRGYNSLSIESGRRFSNPLWVVDGVPMNSFTSPVTGTNALSDLNPETIESIQVLKDASATSLYGSRAANGVILVTTKKGKKSQDAQFSVNLSSTYSVLPAYPTVYGGRGEREYRLKGVMNANGAFYDDKTNTYRYPTSYEDAWKSGDGIYDGFWKYGASGNEDGGVLQDSMNAFYNNSTNFFKYYFQPAEVWNANLQTNGGTERMTYSVGLGYYGETGILKGTGYNRLNLMGNFTFSPVDRLNIDFRTYLSSSDRSRGAGSEGLSTGNEVETIPGDPLELSTLMPGNNAVLDKALKGLQGAKEKNNTYRLRNSFGLNVDILEGLNLSSTVSLDYSQDNRNYFAPSHLSEYKESVSTGEIARNVMLLNESLLTYKRKFGDHSLDAMFGFSYELNQADHIGGSGQNGPSDLVEYVTEGGWPSHIIRENGDINVYKDYSSDFSEKKMMSYFGRLNYNYMQKYIFTATLRRDGSSVFGRNLKWATFPSVAVGWNFSEEGFMDWAEALDFGKLRASWGMSGNQFSSPYLAYGIISGGDPYLGSPSMSPNWMSGYYNPNLSWEETSQYDVGLELEFFNYRLTMTMDYYYRYTDKMLYEITLPGTHSGYANMWKNAAAVSNEGVELEIKYDIFRKKDLKWNISMNISKNWNKFRESHNGEDLQTKGETYVLGRPLGTIWGTQTDGYVQSNDEVQFYYNQFGSYVPFAKDGFTEAYYIQGDVRMTDVNGDLKISSKDDVYLGSSLPKVYGGIVNQVQWKDFDLNMLWSFSLGRDMIYVPRTKSIGTESSDFLYPIFENLDKVTFWEKEGDVTDYPRLTMNNFNGSYSAYSDRSVERVNYLKLKTLTVGYTLPRRWTNKILIKDLRVFFSGENLLSLSNYSGLDPETVDLNTGIDNGKAYPLARRLTLGITIKL